MSRSLIVLDGTTPQALAIVRSLGRVGHRVLVGAPTRRCLASRSRYAGGSFVYPHPREDADAFREELRRVCDREQPALVLPVTDWTTVPLLGARQGLPPLAIADDDAVRTTLSKAATARLAAKAGVPTPRTISVTGPTDWPAHPPLPFPVVVKSDASKSWSEDGVGEQFLTGYARTDDEVQQLLTGFTAHGPGLIQELVPGTGVGLAILAHHGELDVAFQYKRLHEVPLTGGGSSWRQSEALDPALLSQGRALVAELGWHGVAMLEFKRTAEGRYVLIEINGRFWGSLPLPVAAGVDFPRLLTEMLLDGRRATQPKYEVGVRCRSLSIEVEWLVRAALRRPAPIPVRWPTPAEMLGDTVRALHPRERWDTLSLEDPIPGLTRVGEAVARFSAAARRRTERAALVARSSALRRDRRRLAELAATSRTVTVICTGNIIRSVYGAALLAHLAPHLEIRSAGTHARPGRAPHERTLARLEADALPWHDDGARVLTAELLADSDLVLVMELQHLESVRRIAPEAAERTVLLGAFDPAGSLEIADPDQGTADAFREAYAAVAVAIHEVAGFARRGATGHSVEITS